MPANLRELHCEQVPASEAGDYFQVKFEKTPDSDEGYLLVQRQFEFLDGGECYVETDDLDFCGHFRIRKAQLSRDWFRISFGHSPVMQIKVSFKATDSDLAEVIRGLKIIIPDVEMVE